MPVSRFLLVLVFGLLLGAGCTTELDQATRNTPIGDFSLDRLVVIVDQPIIGPITRKIDNAALKEAVTAAVEPRLRRFNGTGSYSIGIKVQGYVLNPKGVPVITPKSQLFLSVNAYDARPARLNADTLNLTVHEDAGGDAFVGSGFSQTAEEQLRELADNAAIEIESWMRENESWFGGKAARGAAPGPLGADAPAQPEPAPQSGA